MYVHVKPNIKQRVLSFFMAFAIIFVSLPFSRFVANAEDTPTGDIHANNDYKYSNQTDNMNAHRTATGSTFVYTGKYNNNNKTTLFDYVSDYELAGTYNTCLQTESGYIDAYTALNSTLSNEIVNVPSSVSTNNITIVYSPDTSLFQLGNAMYIQLRERNSSGTVVNETTWPGEGMNYAPSIQQYSFTFNPSNLGFTPNEFQFNDDTDGRNTSSCHKTYDITESMSVNNTYYVGVDKKMKVTFQPQYASTLGQNMYVHMWNSSGDSTDWNTQIGGTSGNNGHGLVMKWVSATEWVIEIEYKSDINKWRISGGESCYVDFDNCPTDIKFNGSTGYEGYYEINNLTYGYRYHYKRDGAIFTKYPYKSEVGSQSITNNIKYTYPLYFGCFIRGSSDSASDYTSSNKPAYNNFYWQANNSLKPAGGNPGTAAVQKLVYGKLSGDDADNATGDLLDRNATSSTVGETTTISGNALPYFSKSWVNESASHQSLIKYYDKDKVGDKTYDLTFPFYETYSNFDNSGGSNTINSGTVKINDYDSDWDTHGEVARFYQFDSREANLYFNIGQKANTGFFSETNTDIYRGDSINATRSNVGFFPFNSTNVQTGSQNNHNLGFGTKLEMDFVLEEDGCVSAVKLDNSTGSLKSVDTDTRIHTIFEFSGDDDLWVFIDGNLALDMGGDHNRSTGIIDFADKTITVDRAIDIETAGDLSGRTAGDDLSAPVGDDPPGASTITQSTSTTFLSLLSGHNFDSTNPGRYDTKETHTMTIFYMERGMLDSNLMIRYNYAPIENASKMKLAEVTKFTGVNDGLINLTKTAAEDHIFQYTATNTGTTVGDPIDNKAKYKATSLSTRSNWISGWGTALNAYDADGTPAAQLFSPPSDTSTPSRVKNTSYLWVDKFADNTDTVGLTTAGTNNVYTDGGEFYLMYGTDPDLYNKNKTDEEKASQKESSAEFVKQFSRNSTMQFDQGTYLYSIARNSSTHAGTLYDSSGNPQAVKQDGTSGTDNKPVASYYSTQYRVVDRNGNPVTLSNNTNGGSFAFNNRTAAGEGVTNPVSPNLAVQLTEYVENTVRTGKLTIENEIENATSADEEFEYTITINNVFGGSGVNVTDYTKIKAAKGTYSPTNTDGTAAENTINASQKFTLKNGEKLVIEGIPLGTSFTVTETGKTGVTTTVKKNNDAESAAGVYTETGTHTFNTGVNQIGYEDQLVHFKNVRGATELTVEKQDQNGNGLAGAELELYYKEETPAPTYSFNTPQLVPAKATANKITGSITLPDDETVTGTISVESKSYSYGTDVPPTASDSDWILPRSDSDYIYFRDYNTGTLGLEDKPSLNSSDSASKTAWRWSYFETKSNDTHHQDNEIGFKDGSEWIEAQFTKNNGQSLVKYAVWERFVDKYGDPSTGVDTVVWKIQPPDGYTEVRFCMYRGSQCVRTTQRFNFELGKIYHKTKWGKYYKNEGGQHCYFDVPVEAESDYWAPNSGSIKDKRKTLAGSGMDQAIKYKPTEQKIVFHCNSANVWHNIHIQFFDSSNNSINGQPFPGYMMEPYAYAGSDYRMSDGYLTYELTIPDGAVSFQINNGIESGSYAYKTVVKTLYTSSDYPTTKNYHNYFCLEAYSTDDNKHTYSAGADNTDNPKTGDLYNLTDWNMNSNNDPQKTADYTTQTVESDYDYIYFEKPSGWGNQVYAYFYGGGNLRADNWQRACYSAWPGVAPAGTEYTMNDGTTTTNVYSNTYSINTSNNTYNGTTTTGALSPEAAFNNGKTVYKFRVPKGDRKNYSKVIFNDGLSVMNGKHETGVIAYQPGYLYKGDGSCSKHYTSSPTVTYTARSGNDDYIYVKMNDTAYNTWDDLHIKFYDSSDKQILQSGNGYIMDYAGTKSGYKYFRIPIPQDAVRFKLNNGMGKDSAHTLETDFYDILRKTADASSEAATSTDYTKGRLVYELSYSETTTTVTRKEPSFTETTDPPTTTQITGSQNSDVDYTQSTRYDKLKILDDAPWVTVPAVGTNPGIGTFKVKFFDASGSVIGTAKTYTLIQSKADANGKRWYSIEIPDNAASFTLTAPKGAGTVTTPVYEIYPYSANGSGMTGSWTSNGMYYHTKTDGSLALISGMVQSATNEVDDETYAKRGDDLYLVCTTDSWKDITVTFYGADGSPLKTDITAKFVNTSGGDSWYKVSIPQNAVKFDVSGKDGSNNDISTEKADIYEKVTKISRYKKDYTLGDMQYRLPDTGASPREADLLYPKFTEDDQYTLTVGGNTIYSSAGIADGDESAVSSFASAAVGATPETGAYGGATPVLYNTTEVTGDTGYTQAADSSTIMKKWTENGSNSNYQYIRFMDRNSFSSDSSRPIRAYFFNGDTEHPSPTIKDYYDTVTMEDNNNIDRTVYRFEIPDGNYCSVIFTNRLYKNSNNEWKWYSNGTCIQTADISLTGYGHGYVYASNNPADTTTQNGVSIYPFHVITPTEELGQYLRFVDNVSWGTVWAVLRDSSGNVLDTVEMTLKPGETNIYQFKMSTYSNYASVRSVIFQNAETNPTHTTDSQEVVASTDDKYGWGYTYTCSNVVDNYVYIIYGDWSSNDMVVYLNNSNSTEGADYSKDHKEKSNNFLSSDTVGAKFDVSTSAHNYIFIRDKSNYDTTTTPLNISGNNNGRGKVYIVNSSGTMSETNSYSAPSTGGYTVSRSGPVNEYPVIEASVPVSYTATYQPEDRYGLVSASGINSTADENNYIYVDTSENTSYVPYVKFYTKNDGTGTTIAGVKTSNSSESSIKMDSAGTNKYRIRLPKKAKYFKIANGLSGELSGYIPLEETVYVLADRTLTDASDTNGHEMADYRHAGTTFTVNASGVVTTKTLRSGFNVDKDATMADPLNPRSDADYVFFTDTDGFADNGTVYAYYYGGADGEYKAWPGVKASTTNTNLADTTYTDNNGKKVYMFRIPKGTEGSYPKVIFTNGKTTASGDIKITQPQDLTGGKNYASSTASSDQHGAFAASGKVYTVISSNKATDSTTDYDTVNGKKIYIINNGTQNLPITSAPVDNTDRFTLDEIHIVFYEDSAGSNRVGNSGGYKPDKVIYEKYTIGSKKYDVYRITVPEGAEYFQVTNGASKDSTSSQLRERYSEIKQISNNGLYKFVDSGDNAANYLVSSATVPTGTTDQHVPKYLLSVVNVVSSESDEEVPASTKADIHLATIVTGNEAGSVGKQDYIKWLKQVPNPNYDSSAPTSPQYIVDTAYLQHTNDDIYNPDTNTGTKVKKVKVIKQGDYYWKEVKAPTGYEAHTSDVYPVTSENTVVTDDPILGSLKIEKQLAATGYAYTSADEAQPFKFHVKLEKTGYDFSSFVLPSGISGRDHDTTGKLEFDIDVANNTAAANRTISNIPHGTSYTVTEYTDSTNMPTGWVKVSDSGTTGEITSSTVETAYFTNAKTGSLTVSKTVTGTGANVTDFTFTVRLDNTSVDLSGYTFGYSYTPASGVTAITPAANTHPNTLTLTLRNGQSATISGIPLGTYYQVTETNVLSLDWSTSYDLGSGSVVGTSTPASAQITGDVTAAFTNTYTEPYTPPGPSTTNEIILLKTAKEQVGNINIGDPLADAQFQLVNVSGGSAHKFTMTQQSSTDISGKTTNLYTLDDTSGTYNVNSTWLTTGEDGKLHIKNLPNGDYYLEEKAAPSGFIATDSNNSGEPKRVYFSVGSNTVTKNLTCADEMDPAYIKLYEHINEKLPAWGDPTFIFKITQTKDAGGNNLTTPKTQIVALTVNDDGKITDTVKWYDSGNPQNFTEDPINDNLYNTEPKWLVEGTTESEYEGMYHIDSQGRIKVAPGTYQITRIPVSRYKFVTSGVSDFYDTGTEPAAVTASTETITITSLPAGKTVDVHYYDKVDYYDKFSHVDTKVNKFYQLDSSTKDNNTVKGLIVKYDSKAGNSNSTINITTDNDFKAKLVYADGTERDVTDKSKITIDTKSISGLSFDSNTHILTITTPSDHTNKVYTLEATYDSKFTTTFDLVFARS